MTALSSILSFFLVDIAFGGSLEMDAPPRPPP